MEHCITEFRKKTGIDIKRIPKKKIRLYNDWESAEKTLSSGTQTSIDLEYFVVGEDFNSIITKDKLKIYV